MPLVKTGYFNITNRHSDFIYLYRLKKLNTHYCDGQLRIHTLCVVQQEHGQLFRMDIVNNTLEIDIYHLRLGYSSVKEKLSHHTFYYYNSTNIYDESSQIFSDILSGHRITN